MNRLPGWIGVSGAQSIPGRNWQPGKQLRLAIRFLVYAFFALSLTTDYAGSVSFFLLSLLGMYVGLRRGFLNGLSQAEKLLMVAFASYVIISIVGFIFGQQTMVGFRLLGRDLRLLLFIPLYLAVRWSYPKIKHIVIALTIGVTACAITATTGRFLGNAHLLEGATGTHIAFGDLTILLGAWAYQLAFFTLHESRDRNLYRGFAIFSAIASLLTLLLVHSRGGMFALPPIVVGSILMAKWTISRRLTVSIGIIIGACITIVALCLVHYQPLWQGYNHLLVAKRVFSGSTVQRKCLGDHDVLSSIAAHGRYIKPFGASLRIVKVSEDHNACPSAKYAMLLSNPLSSNRPYIAIFKRSSRASAFDKTSLLVSGTGKIQIDDGTAKTVNANSAGFHKLSVHAIESVGASHDLKVFIPPKSRLFLIPLQESPGEYVYPLISNPTGSRIAMWKIAINIFLENPFLGLGTGSFNSLLKEKIAHHEANPSLIYYQHPHNDILNALVNGGILAFIGYLVIFLAPPLAVKNPEIRRIFWIQTIGFFAFGITESMMIHSFVLTYVTVTTAVLLALGHSSLRRDSNYAA